MRFILDFYINVVFTGYLSLKVSSDENLVTFHISFNNIKILERERNFSLSVCLSFSFSLSLCLQAYREKVFEKALYSPLTTFNFHIKFHFLKSMQSSWSCINIAEHSQELCINYAEHSQELWIHKKPSSETNGCSLSAKEVFNILPRRHIAHVSKTEMSQKQRIQSIGKLMLTGSSISQFRS